ncbi:LytR family transcriptional regulator [Salinibacterium sp. dk2585]|uniref:LytR C-terminal domain-containing protein n=1 Tax=unclassified Salinibacterium TaxID=2632331 RepID=UPI0011C24B8A|nr:MULTISPECIES: LytR C-terminal domain-containing protein [unclassified Salinibacterium]QEE62193.1 LytR family transcriptional regulator [Salinibacterium sp. dk2585]TXK53545.1 LytR family transcriptional regulator [Salinibacterium sp. dk5596]
MATRIRDRFDEIPDDLPRVGAHRAPAEPARRWIAFAWAALATVLLVAGGLFGLSLLNPDLDLRVPGRDAAAPADPVDPGPEQPTVEPMLDPTVPITVLNGTGAPGLATQVGDALVAQGWEGASTDVGSRANAAVDDVERTLVFYNDPVNEAAARMIIEHLGVGELRLSNDYPASPIVVLIGADYDATTP